MCQNTTIFVTSRYFVELCGYYFKDITQVISLLHYDHKHNLYPANPSKEIV